MLPDVKGPIIEDVVDDARLTTVSARSFNSELPCMATLRVRWCCHTTESNVNVTAVLDPIPPGEPVS